MPVNDSKDALRDKFQRLFEQAQLVVNHLDTPDDHPLIEIEDLIEKTCGIHKRIKSENPGQDKPNPEFKLVKLLVRELAREKRLRWGPSVGGHKLRPDRDA